MHDSALAFVHRLLTAADSSQPDLHGALIELASSTTDPQQAHWAARLDHVLRQQRLEAATRVVRRLAHDFGNVLTGILGFSELALGLPLAADSPLKAYITEVHRSAQNGASYTNQLRLFARRQSYANRSCVLAAVLSEEEKRLRSAAGIELNLRIEVPADLPAAAVDAEHLRPVLAVLLDNARDAVGGIGNITVSARLVQLDEEQSRTLFGEVRPGAHLEITVTDSGRGLTPDAERQLFAEPFFSTKARKGGFGLATAYGILAAHRGGIELHNRPEGGACARIVVPAAEVPATVEPSPSTAPPCPALLGDKILIVDDDPMILQFVTTTLERAGYRVQAVASADEAVQRYAGAVDDPFRLVLSDVFMPQTNGVELAKRLLAHDGNVRVLFMSGQAAEFPQEAFAPAQFEVLSKPFRPEGLVRAVRAALDRPAAARPAAPATR